MSTHKLEKQVLFRSSPLLPYPESNPIIVSYYYSGALLCSFCASLYVYNDSEQVALLAKRMKATEAELAQLKKWYVEGGNINSNPEDYDPRYSDLNYLEYLRARSEYTNSF